MRSIPRRLSSLGSLYDKRSSVYGDDYVHAGKILAGYFPRGITLKTPDEFRRFYMYVHMVGKMNRYAHAVARGEGHMDSLNDLSVYSQMTQETDDLAEGK